MNIPQKASGFNTIVPQTDLGQHKGNLPQDSSQSPLKPLRMRNKPTYKTITREYKQNPSTEILCIRALASYLKGLDALRSLAIEFKLSIRNYHLNTLTQTMQKSETFLLRCPFPNLSIHGIKALFSALKNIRNLQSLQIKLFLYKFDDSVTKVLFRSIKSLKSLLHLSINLGSSQFATSQTARNLAKSILTLKSLLSLNIAFNGCSRIGDPGFIAFASELIGLKNLTKLRISLPLNISEDSFQALSKSLIKLNSLENLELSFSHLSNLNDDNLKLLIVAIQDLPSLKNLELKFFKCLNLSTFIVIPLSLLRNIDSLLRLKIELLSCYNINETALEDLRRSLSHIPQCEISSQAY